ncbi:MAG: M48 family metalloprotease, partial [Armatimonadota bacterium]
TRALAVLLAALMVVSLVLTAGCKGPRLLSREDEIKLGREAGDDFEREQGLDTDPRTVELVRDIGKKIAQAAVPPEYPYDFRVLRGKDVNAVAFPGGRIYAWRGLVELFDYDPHMIAWVLGHEASHVSQRHATRRLEKSLGFEALVALAFRKSGAQQVAALVANLVMQDYGRDQEYEADRWGCKYAYDAGYDPSAAVAVLRKFQELQKREPSKVELLFATHPGNNDRINAVERYLKEQGWSGQYWKP